MTEHTKTEVSVTGDPPVTMRFRGAGPGIAVEVREHDRWVELDLTNRRTAEVIAYASGHPTRLDRGAINPEKGVDFLRLSFDDTDLEVTVGGRAVPAEEAADLLGRGLVTILLERLGLLDDRDPDDGRSVT